MRNSLLLLLTLMGCDQTEEECTPSNLIRVYIDLDNDGYGQPGTEDASCTVDRGFTTNGNDCDDTRQGVNPGALELCDGLDNDCDEEVDEGLRVATYYLDADGDGFGNPDETTEACTAQPGFSADNTDCDDTNPLTNPAAPEICDGGIDNDCDRRADDEEHPDAPVPPNAPETYIPNLDLSTATTYYFDNDSDGFGGQEFTIVQCERPNSPQAVLNSDDCDDFAPTISPAAIERCNLVDDDCDQLIDDSDPDLDIDTQGFFWADYDQDGSGDPNDSVRACFVPWFYASNQLDCDDTEPCIQGAAGWVVDGDNDGYGAGEVSSESCTAPTADHVLQYQGELCALSLDCKDDDSSIYPTAPEECDGIDNDCDFLIDDEDTEVDAGSAIQVYPDLDGDGYGVPGDEANPIFSCAPGLGTSASTDDCDDGNAAINPGANEECDAIDNDCDELVDDDDVSLDPASALTWYADFDGDGFGRPDLTASACGQPALYVGNDDDCDDEDEFTTAGPEYGRDADGDGVVGSDVETFCVDPGADYLLVTGDLDCVDTDATIYQGALEVCGDGIDQDCDFADVPDCLADTCEDADLGVLIQTGVSSYAQSVVDFSDEITLVPGECTGNITTAGADAIVAVHLEVDEAITTTLAATPGVDTTIAIQSVCGDATTCVAGGNAKLANGGEQLTWHNTTGAAFDGYIALDCASDCTVAAADFNVRAGTLAVPDTCAEANLATPLMQGTHQIIGDLTNFTDEVSLLPGNTCTGMATLGNDAIIPVLLFDGGGVIIDHTSLDGDSSVHVMSTCGDELTCEGADDALTGTQNLVYINSSGALQIVYVGLDCAGPVCGAFDTTLNVF